MPYTVEKGAFFELIEDRYSTMTIEERQALLTHLYCSAEVIPRSQNTSSDWSGTMDQPVEDFPEYADATKRIHHILGDWFGYTGENFENKQEPFHAEDNPRTGKWCFYGDVEEIFRQTLIRAIEASLGYPHFGDSFDCDGEMKWPTATRTWPIQFLWTCASPKFEGYVTWRDNDTRPVPCQAIGGLVTKLPDKARDIVVSTACKLGTALKKPLKPVVDIAPRGGLVTVVFNTPGGQSAVSHDLVEGNLIHPEAEFGWNRVSAAHGAQGGQNPHEVTDPNTAHGLVVIGHRLVVPALAEGWASSAPQDGIGDECPPILGPDQWPTTYRPDDTKGEIVAVKPSEIDGGVLSNGRVGSN